MSEHTESRHVPAMELCAVCGDVTSGGRPCQCAVEKLNDEQHRKDLDVIQDFAGKLCDLNSIVASEESVWDIFLRMSERKLRSNQGTPLAFKLHLLSRLEDLQKTANAVGQEILSDVTDDPTIEFDEETGEWETAPF